MPTNRALHGWGRFRSHGPGVLVISYRVRLKGWLRPSLWLEWVIRTAPTVDHCLDILSAGGWSLNSLLLCWRLHLPRLSSWRWSWQTRCLHQQLCYFYRMFYWLKWAYRTWRVKIHCSTFVCCFSLIVMGNYWRGLVFLRVSLLLSDEKWLFRLILYSSVCLFQNLKFRSTLFYNYIT